MRTKFFQINIMPIGFSPITDDILAQIRNSSFFREIVDMIKEKTRMLSGKANTAARLMC